MPRDLNPVMQAALASGSIQPFFLAALSFLSPVQYVWTGVGNLVFEGNTYIGVGSFGSFGGVSEGVQVEAQGTSIMLSGLDPVWLDSCLTEFTPGSPAIISFGLMANGVIIGTPYQIFVGTMDSPAISIDQTTASITIVLENRMIDLARPSGRLYTSADQRLYFPQDTGFGWVEQLADTSNIWG
jgi:hypothetical protein